MLIEKNFFTEEQKEQLINDFPELAESEEERIRKALIEVFKKKLEKGFEWVEYGIPNRSVLDWLEKQKEANKAMEAVDKIDKYIDENVTNAHDMKKSHPDKKYCQGIDATLSDISGILLDVYSEKENKFAPRVLPCSAAWFEDGDEKQQEQKHTLKFKVGDKVHLEGDDVNILTITGIEKDRYLTDNSYGPILFGTEDIWQIVEQKPAEDKELLKNILFQKKGITYDDYKYKNDPYVGLYFDELIKCLEEYDKARSNK